MTVSGRVQGVFFRDSCRQQAERAGVTGWVANRSDGTVEAELEGEEQAVAAVVQWAYRGPARAVVDKVEVVKIPPTGGSGFTLR